MTIFSATDTMWRSDCDDYRTSDKYLTIHVDLLYLVRSEYDIK